MSSIQSYHPSDRPRTMWRPISSVQATHDDVVTLGWKSGGWFENHLQTVTNTTLMITLSSQRSTPTTRSSWRKTQIMWSAWTRYQKRSDVRTETVTGTSSRDNSLRNSEKTSMSLLHFIHRSESRNGLYHLTTDTRLRRRSTGTLNSTIERSWHTENSMWQSTHTDSLPLR